MEVDVVDGITVVAVDSVVVDPATVVVVVGFAVVEVVDEDVGVSVVEVVDEVGVSVVEVVDEVGVSVVEVVEDVGVSVVEVVDDEVGVSVVEVVDEVGVSVVEVVDDDVVGGASQPVTQNTLCFTSAPCEPSAFTVSFTCHPCWGWGSNSASALVRS
jgi:hypothetical protein